MIEATMMSAGVPRVSVVNGIKEFQVTFNGNTSPKTRKTERPTKTWECAGCGTENKPWLKQCLGCGKRKD